MKIKIFKNTIALFMCIALILIGCINVSAEDAGSATASADNTSDNSFDITSSYSMTVLPESKPLDKDVEAKIKDDYIKTLDTNENNITPDMITVDYYGTLSDGSMLVYAEYANQTHPSVMAYCTLGKYIYVYGGDEDVKIYKQNSFYSIKELYDSKAINDAQLDEIAVLLNLQLMTEHPATDDSPKNNTNNNSNNANNSIATGLQSKSLLVIISVLIISASVVLFLRKSRNEF